MLYNILQHLINLNGGKTDFLECTQSSVLSGDKCENIYSYGTDGKFETQGISNDYVQIHIMNYYILPFSYRIRSFYLRVYSHGIYLSQYKQYQTKNYRIRISDFFWFKLS